MDQIFGDRVRERNRLVCRSLPKQLGLLWKCQPGGGACQKLMSQFTISFLSQVLAIGRKHAARAGEGRFGIVASTLGAAIQYIAGFGQECHGIACDSATKACAPAGPIEDDGAVTPA